MKYYSNKQSRGNTLLPLFKELGIENDIEMVEVDYAKIHDAEYLRINPMGKVPCLVDGRPSSVKPRLSMPIWRINIMKKA